VTIPTYSWVHCVLVKSGNTVSIFQNGTRTGTITNSNSYSNTSDAITVGTNRYLPGDKFNGYISNLRLVKGTAVYDPSQSSITVPTSPLTAIPNTSLLTCQSSAFVDNSTNNFTITANGDARVDFRSPFEEPVNTDSLVDVPTNGSEPDTGVGGEVRGNYCTWNPLNGSGALADGNLSFTSSASVHKRIGTIGVASGKWYFEAVCTAQATQNQGVGIGNINAATDSLGIGSTTNSWALICESGSANGWLYHNQSVAADIGNVNVNDVMMIAYDADSGKLWFGVNGSWYNSGNPAAGTNASFTSVSGSAMFPAVSGGQTTPGTIVANFGQRPWAYQAPAGFKALCTANLPAPTIEDGSTAMDVVTYTGNGSTQTISGLGFSPDLVWVKGRVGILNHVLADTVRGANLKLASNTTGAEAGTDNGTVSAFNSDGFTVAMGGGTYPGYETNRSGDPYVGWAWDAGSSTVTNNDGSISSQVRANPSAGFSVVTYTGNGTGGATVGHGLGAKPFLRIIKRRDATSTFGWMTFHESAPTSFFTLNTTAAATPASEPAPTSTVFSLPTDVNSNANNGTYVAYCFAPVEGYSAFGSYTGNGSADGPFVYTGFRPRYILIKNSTYAGQAWWILDTARDDANVADNYLQANSSNAEGTFTVGDILSNGFKIRTTDIALNGSTHTIIFAAFAENPFSLARAR
jgi:hypothetical protein